MGLGGGGQCRSGSLTLWAELCTYEGMHGNERPLVQCRACEDIALSNEKPPCEAKKNVVNETNGDFLHDLGENPRWNSTCLYRIELITKF